MPDFRNRLRDLRKAAQLTQDALADRVQASQGHISKIESGTAEPAPEMLPALARALGTSLWGLVGGTEYANCAAGSCLVSVEGDQGIRWVAYFASALTGLDSKQRENLEAHAALVREVCEAHHTFLYEPSHYTDPVNNPDISPDDVYTIDRKQVSSSDVIILHADLPSFGAGQEIEIGTNAGIPVILVASKATRVSRMVRGCFAGRHLVTHETPDELKQELDRVLKTCFNDLSLRTRAACIGLGERIARLRAERSVERSVLARAVGLAEHAIAAIESGPVEQVNPSVLTLTRIAAVLKTSVAYLVEGAHIRPDDSDPTISKSRESLHRYASRAGTPFSDVQRAWEDYSVALASQRRAVADARTEPVTEKEWEERLRGQRGNGQGKLALDGDD